MHDRVAFETVGGALRSWGKIDRSEIDRVLELVVALEAELGQVRSAAIAQRGNAVDVSFGTSDRIDLYVHSGYADIAPHAVTRLGGMDKACALTRGLRPGTGQRSASARLPLRHHRPRTDRRNTTGVSHPSCCGIEQPADSECMLCGTPIGNVP